MKKWWLLLLFFSITTIIIYGQAIDLKNSMEENQDLVVKGTLSNQMDYIFNEKVIKLVKNGHKSTEQKKIPDKDWLPEPNHRVFTPIQVQAKEKEKEQPKKIGKPSIYLTFDDGPNQELDEILNILKAKQAKATFFMIEPQMKHYQEGVKRLVNEGHYPAIHSVTHDKNKLYSGSPLNMINEMEQTKKAILAITGVESKLIRAPYGSKPFMKDSYRNVLVQHQMKMWDWNIDTMDWKFQRSNPHQILVNMINGLESVKNKKGPIVILLHVTKGTASVLPQVIDYLYSKGYQCQAYNPSNHQTINFWNDSRL